MMSENHEKATLHLFDKSMGHLQRFIPNRRSHIFQPTAPKTGGCLEKIITFKDVHV